jgi:lipopolysaccharide/colanic/teichoic acid biosynthesis glycosyltransferase
MKSTMSIREASSVLLKRKLGSASNRGHVRSIFSGAQTSPSRNVLVFGTSAVSRAATRELERSGYTAIRFTESDGDGNPGQPLRTISRASRVIAETKPVRIVVCLRSPLEELPLCELLEQQIGGVPVETGHEAYERLTGKIFLDERTTLHLLLSHAGLNNRVYGTTKRFVSSVVAGMALVVALPVMALIALSIYVTEGRPVLFVHERVGLHGRPFRLLKFRSMRAEKGTSSQWERDNEERITPLGRWLRKLHLDELPQLWNILRGDMDLVGPRPHPVSNHELFARSIPYYSLRSVVRPGLTGWAQVRQGYAHDVPGEIEKMRYDLFAIARPSLLRDLWVLLATAKIVPVGHSPLDREALPATEKADRDDSVALPFGALTASATLRVFYLAMASVRRQGFARLLAAVVILSIAAENLRLIAQTRINTRPNPAPPAMAMAIRPSEPTSPAAATAMAMAAGLANLRRQLPLRAQGLPILRREMPLRLGQRLPCSGTKFLTRGFLNPSSPSASAAGVSSTAPSGPVTKPRSMSKYPAASASRFSASIP